MTFDWRVPLAVFGRTSCTRQGLYFQELTRSDEGATKNSYRRIYHSTTSIDHNIHNVQVKIKPKAEQSIATVRERAESMQMNGKIDSKAPYIALSVMAGIHVVLLMLLTEGNLFQSSPPCS
jgi:hypothetical protein